MSVRIMMNGKEITSFFAKLLIGVFAVLLSGLIAAGVIFVVLPLVGIVVGVTVGVVAVLLVALGLGLPLFILGGSLLAAVVWPFVALAAAFRGRRRGGPG